VYHVAKYQSSGAALFSLPKLERFPNKYTGF